MAEQADAPRFPEELRRRALDVLTEVRRQHPEYAEITSGIDVEISTRMTRAAGKALGDRRVIRLSWPLFSRPENLGQLDETLTHELAHLIVGTEQGHSAAWRAVHHRLGGTGERCHSMLPAAASSPPVFGRCDRCGETLALTPGRARNLASGRMRYRHRGCGGELHLPGANAGSPGDGRSAASDEAARTSSAHNVRCERCGRRLRIGPIRFRRLAAGETTYRHARCGGRLLSLVGPIRVPLAGTPERLVVCDRCELLGPIGPRQAEDLRSGRATYEHRSCGGKLLFYWSHLPPHGPGRTVRCSGCETTMRLGEEGAPWEQTLRGFSHRDCEGDLLGRFEELPPDGLSPSGR